MKNVITLTGFFLMNAVHGQYFQQRFNLDYSTPKLRNERMNSGIITGDNFINLQPIYYYNVGIGTSYNNLALPAPDNNCDRLRFVQVGTYGLTMFGNWGHQFANFAGRWYNAYGNSIAELKNESGTGGFVAVGAVTNNQLTEANGIPGSSDILFTRLDALGNVLSARRIDLNQSTDAALCIRKSSVLVNGQQSWIICGQSQRQGFTDCFVARVLVDGTIVWARRYNFDFGGGQFNSAICIAKQLCEAPNGNIYAVGTIQDVPAAANGIDGLAFALTPNGAVIWANNYHAFTDDEFQAVRFSSNGTLAVGGFTNFGAVAPVTSHMLFTQLNPATGAVIAQNVLRAASGGTIYTSRCYDLVQTPGARYYLAGPVITQNGVYEMMYGANAAGIGVNWYRYNRMNYNVGFGIDFSGIAPGAGIAYFSSLRDSINPAISDAHIMKTDFNGRTCKVCPNNPPSNLPVNLQVLQRANRNSPTGNPSQLIWTSFNYNNSATCNDEVITCDGPPAIVGAGDASSAKAGITATSIRIYPNPVANILHLQFYSLPAGEYSFTMVNTEGKTVLQKNKVYNNGFSNTDLDVTMLAPGIYMLNAINGNTIFRQKVVKQ